LLIDKNRCVKVTDFGFSQLKQSGTELKDNKDAPKGTALYMAPEVMKGKPFNEKADVFSYGLILHEIMTGQEIFPEYEDWDEFEEAVCVKKVRPPIAADCEPSLKYLIEKCWDADPEQRPSFKEIVFRLDEILVDLHLRPGEGRQYTVEGRKFWKDNFLTPKQTLTQEVLWKDFVKILSRDLKMPAAQFDQLDHLVTTHPKGLIESEPVVTLEIFSRVLQWFGPIFLPDKAGPIIKDMKTLIGQKWFHGEISIDVAEKLLARRDIGCFLIRLSITNPKCPFTISKIGSDNKIQHRRVSHIPDGFSVPVRTGEKVFKNVLEMVECQELGLKTACPKTALEFNPYEDTYTDPKKQPAAPVVQPQQPPAQKKK